MLNDLLGRWAAEIRILSRDEEKHDIRLTTLRSWNIRYYIGDIRDCVFHPAVLKQAPSCEFFPIEAVRTNILGSKKVIRSATANGVRSDVCLSNDTAVLPVNTKGMSKAMREKLAQALARSLGPDTRTTVSMVRYGNVMYSRRSIIPLFIRQINTGAPSTVTEPQLTRFLIPLRDCMALAHHVFDHARQGDLFIRKAAASTIADLVTARLELFGLPDHPIDAIGWHRAEKLYETLMKP